MTRWCVGSCRLEVEDEHSAIYSYRGDDWDLEADVRDRVKDDEGMFTVCKRHLDEAKAITAPRQTRGKRGRNAGEEVVVLMDVEPLLNGGHVSFDILCGADRARQEMGASVPRTLVILLEHIAKRYHLNGKVPEKAAFTLTNDQLEFS